MSGETIIARALAKPVVVNIHKVTLAMDRIDWTKRTIGGDQSIVSSSLPFSPARGVALSLRNPSIRGPDTAVYPISRIFNRADRSACRKQFIRRAIVFYCIFVRRRGAQCAADNYARCWLFDQANQTSHWFGMVDWRVTFNWILLV